jgi:CMP-N-acetylneuraminic acid synthetase
VDLISKAHRWRPEEVFCLIPARAGSTRVPDKNIKPLAGSPLLEIAIRKALLAFGRAFVSTDSPHYREIAISAGALAPGLRPAEISGADASSDQAIVHALTSWAENERYLVLVQVTAPFLSSQDMIGVLDLVVENSQLTYAMTAVRADPRIAYALAVDPKTRTGSPLLPQLTTVQTHRLPLLALPSGGAWASRTDRLRAGELLEGDPAGVYLVDQDHALDIDTEEDYARAVELVASSAKHKSGLTA